MDLVTLKLLWDFLSQILSDSIKERLKPKKSDEVAKDKAFYLYRNLILVAQRSDLFIEEIKYYLLVLKKNIGNLKSSDIQGINIDLLPYDEFPIENIETFNRQIDLRENLEESARNLSFLLKNLAKRSTTYIRN